MNKTAQHTPIITHINTRSLALLSSRLLLSKRLCAFTSFDFLKWTFCSSLSLWIYIYIFDRYAVNKKCEELCKVFQTFHVSNIDLCVCLLAGNFISSLSLSNKQKVQVYSKTLWKGQMCRRLLKQKRETCQCQIYVEAPAWIIQKNAVIWAVK